MTLFNNAAIKFSWAVLSVKKQLLEMGCLQFLALECFPESHRDSVRWCQNVIETILKRCTTYNYFCGVYAKNKSAAAGHQLIDTHYWSDHRNDMWFLQKLIRKPKGQDEPQPSLTNHSVHANSRCLLFLGSKLTSSCLINTWLKPDEFVIKYFNWFQTQ